MPERRYIGRDQQRLILRFPAAYSPGRSVELAAVDQDGGEQILLSREAADWRRARAEAAKLHEQLAAKGYTLQPAAAQTAKPLDVPLNATAANLEAARQFAQQPAAERATGKPGRKKATTTQTGPTPTPVPIDQLAREAKATRQIRIEEQP